MNKLHNIDEKEIRQRQGSFNIFARKSELFLRIVFGLPLAVLTLFITWLGGSAFYIFALFFAIAMFFEYSRMCRRGMPLSIVALSWFLFFLSLATWLAQAYGLSIALGALSFFFLLTWEIMVRRTGWIAVGFLYAFLPFCALIYLRGQGDEGFYVVAALFIFVWGVDTIAYVAGKIFLGPKLAPKISPGKTWSGFLGGLIGGTLIGWFTIKIFGYCARDSFWFVCIALAVFSQVGDLAESALKRRFNVKDSGALIPGHGGVLDRVDGLVFVMVATWIMVLTFSSLPFDKWVKKYDFSFIASIISNECNVDFLPM